MKLLAFALLALWGLTAAQNPVIAQPWEADLEGEWRFRTGDDPRWAEASFDDSEWEELHAPEAWDDQGYADYDGYGWYRRRFFVPAQARGKRLLFAHEGVDDDDWVYVNGTLVGEGKGCYVPRTYAIPADVVRPGQENVIAVRIYDGAMGGGLVMGPVKVKEATLADQVDVSGVRLTGGGDRMSLHLEVTNRERVPHSLRCAYELSDAFGRRLVSGEESFALAANGTLARDIPVRGGDGVEFRATFRFKENGRSADVVRYLQAESASGVRSVLNLSGEWEMLFPAGDRLSFPPSGEWRKAAVPTGRRGGWEGDNHRAWFRKSFALGGGMKGRRLKLRFEAVAHHAQVYVNGVRVGEHLGGFEPFEVDVTTVVRQDAPNEVIVGVTDWVAGLVEGKEPTTGEGRWPKDAVLIPFGTRPPTRKGIWDDVRFIAQDDVSIRDVFPTTSVREGKLRLAMELANEGAALRQVTVENAVFDGDAEVLSLPAQAVALPAGGSQAVVVVQSWPHPHLWWPQDPHLYRLRTTLVSDGRVLDEANTRFGFREFRIDGLDYRLNGAVFKLRGLICPPLDATRDEIRDYYLRAKASNFSLVRFHMQPRAHYFYDIADEVGMCVKDESAFYCAQDVYALADPRLWENLAAHVRGMVLRARAHPAVCIWSVENEILHCGGTRVQGTGARIFELGRLISSLDPSRPVEYEGDGDMEGRADTANIHYPREFGCHNHNLWPNDAHWLGKEGNDRWPREFVWRRDKPLIMGEFCYYPYSRPPGGLSVFAGDRAYVSLEDEKDAHVQGVKFLCDGARRAGVAGLNPWVGDWRYALECLKPVAVTVKEYDGHCFGGDAVTRSLAVHNDTLDTKRLRLVCRATVGRKTAAKDDRTFDIAPGAIQEVTFSWQMPETAERAAAVLDVSLLDGASTAFRERRPFTVFPRRALSAPAGLRMALYDPAGETAKALHEAGLSPEPLADLSSLDSATCDLLLVGKDALSSEAAAAEAARVAQFAAAGGKAFFFEQRRSPSGLPADVKMDAGHAATIAFIRSASHPLWTGLEEDDLRFWRGDHLVSRAEFVKPSKGAFRILADSGGLGGLRWAPVVEVPCGKGFVVLSQLLLTEKLATEPTARLVLQNLLNYAARYAPAPPVRVGVAASQDGKLKAALAGIGLRCDDLPTDLASADLTPYGLLILGRDDPALAQGERLRQFVAAGGKLLVHCPTGSSEASLRELVPGLKSLKRCRPKGKLVKTTDGGLMEGLSNSDFYWYREDCRYLDWEGHGSGLIQNPAGWQAALAPGPGTVFTKPAAVVSIPYGAGAFVVNTIPWDDVEAELRDKAFRIGSTLLLNLGALPGPAGGQTLISDQ